MPITQTITPIPQAGKRGIDNQATFVTKQEAFQDTLTSTTVTQLNTLATQINTAQTAMATSESNSKSSETNAATSATTATAKALIVSSVVIPTTATYNYTTQDWRDTMMSKAEFNAMAASERRVNAGSGFYEFGQHAQASGVAVVNEGLWVFSTLPNVLSLGNANATTSGISKTRYAISSINGILHNNGFINSPSVQSAILLPPAPTVLPSTATLTQQQIDSGVIQHADASNSGLILNGKFDTDTSGWIPASGATLSIETSALRILGNGTGIFPGAYQTLSLIVGKKYKVEFEIKRVGSGITLIGEVLTPQTGNGYYYPSAIGKYSVEFTATVASIDLKLIAASSATGDALFDNIVVFPADAISRSDLVFLESDDYVDVSVNDFVYPLGNKQYLGTTGDCGTTVVGAFAGSATYSLFSDIWQADGALVGRGYVWSTLSDTNKKLFVANPENNCYLDGDKVIQVQYKVRVEQGKSDLPLMSQYSFLTDTTKDAGLWYK